MIKKSKKLESKNRFLAVLPYILTTIVLIALVFAGTMNKEHAANTTLSMDVLANNNFNSVSTDQISEFYMVASLADSMKLASSETVSSNYVTVSVLAGTGQTATSDKIEKPTITDTSGLARCGVNTHTVVEGETAETIAGKYGVTTDQVRWSNGLKTNAVSAGQVLQIPGTNGIVYTVKSGDTVDALASKYGSSAEEIVICNDLETSQTLAVGTKIVLPSGSLPETERPEYVAPTRSYTTSTTTYYASYSYSGSATYRENLRVIATGFYASSPGNPGVAGQCTWYAWYMRATDSRSLGTLPGGMVGNANAWANTYGNMGYVVNKTPVAGAVFQTAGGSYYGHVGYVTEVHSDGSITVREMNLGVAYRVTESEIPANMVGNFNYIH